jgi:transcriptional regulator with XRE-family HTH domain
MTKRSTKTRSPLLEYMDRALEAEGLLDQADAELEELRLEQYVLKARRLLGMSQSELAKKAGIAQPHLSRLEAGQAKNITLRTLFRTATALGSKVQIRFLPSTKSRRSRTTPDIDTKPKKRQAANRQ